MPLADQLGALKQLRDDGVIRHIGLSEVTVEQLKEARDVVEVASVQNLYNLTDRRHEPVLDFCAQEGICFVPWLPIAGGRHAEPGGVLAEVAVELGATTAQVSLAWLLHRSPVIVPIPGTGSMAHLEENAAAAALRLSDAQFALLSALS